MIAIPLGEAFPYKKEGVLILHFRSQKSGFGTLGYSERRPTKVPQSRILLTEGFFSKFPTSTQALFIRSPLGTVPSPPQRLDGVFVFVGEVRAGANIKKVISGFSHREKQPFLSP